MDDEPRRKDGEPMRVAEVEGPPPAQRSGGGPAKAGAAALTLGALGVVFGDIGTSPLYALDAVFHESDVKPDQASVYGIISLVFWSITLIVSVKYVLFIMRADNEGEGGIMALIALLQSALKDTRGKVALVAAGVFGASLFYGDGMITPAISVLSAVEGLEVISPSLESIVIPATLTILTILFFIQRFGTGAVGRLFGPVMGLWFSVLAVSGLAKVIDDPSVVKALSPSYAVEFFANDFGIAFLSLGGVVLAVTGAEALYADMGHFGRKPIRRAWFWLVFPALTLNYLGQGALIVESPKAISNPFFLLMPDWARVPVVVLATMAAVIASQAVISGAFSVTRQAVQLGFLPRLTIHHTSEEEVGQVYAPAINMVLFVAVIALVVGFGSSESLAAAYGIAVTGTLAIDTVLFFVVVRVLWGRPWWLVGAGVTLFLVIDLSFFGANVPKIVHGGWFPLVVGLAVFTVLMTWQRGRELVTEARRKEEGPLQAFVDEIHEMDPPLHRTPGTAVFLNAGKSTTPLAMRANVEAQPQPARGRGDPVARDAEGAARAPVRAAGDRRAGLRGRRHRARDRAARFPGQPGRPGDDPRGRRAHRRVRHRRRLVLVLRLPHHDRAHRRSGHGDVAQAPVPERHAAVVEPGRVLQAARRAHGDDGSAHRVLTRRIPTGRCA